MTPVDQRAVWEQVVAFVELNPDGVGRSQVARQFGVAKSTALSHLEKACERDRLIKVYTWLKRNSRGWVYYPKGQFDELQNGGLDNDTQP